ncbi:helix-turn-helix domain-containing protein [Hydrogenophaga sp.]|uniref:helix-turn-helix domain-containing protein n=1 Tax=Hydrogenophaga sp. TaxID=1904254 RepID=UPI003F711F70
MTDTPPILNAAQLATLLRCSERTVEDYARTGRIPGTKFGDSWVFVYELVIEAVKRISLEEAAKRSTPSKPDAPAAVIVSPKSRKRREPPGLRLLPQHAVSQILTPQ